MLLLPVNRSQPQLEIFGRNKLKSSRDAMQRRRSFCSGFNYKIMHHVCNCRFHFNLCKTHAYRETIEIVIYRTDSVAIRHLVFLPNCLPMQFLGPIPNGINVYGFLAAFFSDEKCSGSNSSGLS